MSLGEYDQALAEFNQATSLTIKNATYWNNKGLAYKALGKPADALTCFQTALGIDPNFADAQNNAQSVTGMLQNFNITGTVTPVPTISRIGTLYTTAPPTPQPATAITAAPSAGITTQIPATATPVPTRTTYTPLTPLPALGALAAAGGIMLALKRK